MKLLQDVNVNGKAVFLRVDFNVPIEKGEITDSNRIRAALPTIKFLVESRAKVIIGTHLGRPEGKLSAETSIAPVAKELERMLNLKVTMAKGVIDDETKKLAADLKAGQILILENLRWDPREEKNDSAFAKELASMAEIYVNDAFAVSHRANASVEAITKFLPSYAGLLLQSEITHLQLLLANPEHPFVLIIGGVKVVDKAGMIEKLAPHADNILVGGGVANTFLKARGEEMSKSVVDEEMVPACKKMLVSFGNKIILPIDCVTDSRGVIPAQAGISKIPDQVGDDNVKEFKILDIGPATIEKFCSIIRAAQTVLWNGNLGYTEDPEFQAGTKAVAKAMQLLRGTTVIAGGDTVGFVKSEGLDKGISFISTGGGAALEFLAGEKLPGIVALN